MGLRMFSACLLCLFCSLTNAQSPVTSVIGLINDQISGEPIIGATVQLSGLKDTAQTVSNSLGIFQFNSIAAGRYQLLIKYLGYTDHKVSEIELVSGRQLELAIGLKESVSDLPVTVVRGDVRAAENIAATSIQTLTIEEVRRFPATFNDPARLALAYPGVANANDQANELIIRGNSPAGVSWRIAGAEIVNPNHLSNAGNEFDRVSDSGGGVNALSAQMLKSSYFLSGAFPAQYGNALAGVLDMNLRPGNRTKWESTIQLGLLGLDFSVEGPFSKKNKASYLINYRYSTIGLLDAIGVPVSDESITFQDLAFHFNFPSRKAGQFSIFGIGGQSSNVLEAKTDSTEWQLRRDRSAIDYKSRLGILGISHHKNTKKWAWKTTLAYSGVVNSRQEAYFTRTDLLPIHFSMDSLVQTKMSFHSSGKLYQNRNLQFLFGLEVNYENYFLNSSFGLDFPAGGTVDSWLIQPYLSAQYQLSRRVSVNAGFRFISSSVNNQTAALPRMNVSFRASENDKSSLSWGVQSRQTPFYINLLNNQFLNFIKADHIVLSHTHHFSTSNFIRGELYYEHLYDVPEYHDPLSIFSALNVEEVYLPLSTPLSNTGEGRNLGIEISWQQYLQKDFYFLVNGSVFNSEFKDSTGNWRNTRYNSKYIINMTGGKEFSWQKKWPRTLGINLHFNATGGQWYTPIHLPNSQQLDRPVYRNENPFSEQYPAYYKVDLRIYLRTNKNKRSTSLSLDIQNITNRKNVGYYFYDRDSGDIEVKEQLGLIPILNWRIDL